MGKYNKSSKQKMHRMKGSSKSTRRNKKHLGGSSDVNLAYPSTNVPTVSNSNLAYSPSNVDIGRAYPSLGPTPSGFNFLNSNSQHGGSCGCGMPSMTGGTSHRPGCTCNDCMEKMSAGSKHGSKCMCSKCKRKRGGKTRHNMGCKCGKCMGKKRGGSSFSNSHSCTSSKCTDMMGGSAHRIGCKCSMCKSKMTGGGGCNNPMSNNGIPYPDGLLGNAWKPSVSGWPGVDGVSMNRNHLGYNTYAPNDVSRQMLDVGAAPPFTYLGGKSRKNRKNKRGGTLSNFLGQDLINLGRQFQYGVGTSYNAIRGYSSPVNPMPWKDQMTHKPVQLPS